MGTVKRSKQTLQKQHDEVSKSISRLLLALIGYSLFCILTLGTDDASLLRKTATITMPFAGTQVSFISFLFIGPTVLILLTSYLHVFVGYWNRLGGRQYREASPQIHNLPTRWAVMLSGCLLYWLTPTVLAIFAWKALPRVEGPLLIFVSSAVATWLAWLQISRWKTPNATWLKRVWILVPMAFVTLSIVQSYYLLNDGRFVKSWFALQTHVLPSKYIKFWSVEIFPRILLERQVNLSGADLSNQSISDISINNGYLDYANLKHTVFSDSQLSNTELIAANLAGSEFIAVMLNGANLRQANLSGAHFDGVSFIGANLQSANLSGAHFFAVSFSGANLQGANLSGAVFFADLANANLRDANLSGAHMQFATDLTCEQLTQAKRWWEAERAPLQACGRKIPTILTKDPFLESFRSLVVPPSHATPRHPRE